MSTQAEILAVLKDCAEHEGSVAPEVREWVAKALPDLRIAGPWVHTPGSSSTHRRYQQGTAILAAAVSQTSLNSGEWWVGNAVGHSDVHRSSLNSAQVVIDAQLKADGWIVCAPVVQP